MVSTLRVNVSHLLTSVEPIISRQTPAGKHQLRSNTSNLIFKFKYNTPVNNSLYMKITKHLKSDYLIVIIKADKGLYWLS